MMAELVSSSTQIKPAHMFTSTSSSSSSSDSSSSSTLRTTDDDLPLSTQQPDKNHPSPLAILASESSASSLELSSPSSSSSTSSSFTPASPTSSSSSSPPPSTTMHAPSLSIPYFLLLSLICIFFGVTNVTQAGVNVRLSKYFSHHTNPTYLQSMVASIRASTFSFLQGGALAFLAFAIVETIKTYQKRYQSLVDNNTTTELPDQRKQQDSLSSDGNNSNTSQLPPNCKEEIELLSIRTEVEPDIAPSLQNEASSVNSTEAGKHAADALSALPASPISAATVLTRSGSESSTSDVNINNDKDASLVHQLRHFHWPPVFSRDSWYLWLGGLCGALYVTLSIILLLFTSYTIFFICSIIGQLLVSCLLDHLGYLGYTIQRLSFVRLCALLLTCSGAILLQDFNSSNKQDAKSQIAGAVGGVIAGALMVSQAALNRRLSYYSGNPVVVSIISYSVASSFLLTISVLSLFVDDFNTNGAMYAWWMWSGGVFGFTWVIGSILITPLVGVTHCFLCVISGNLMTSLIYDSIELFSSSTTLKNIPLYRCILAVVLSFCGAAWISILRHQKKK